MIKEGVMNKSILRKRPILFCIFLIFAWLILNGLVAFALSLIFKVSLISIIPQTAARISGVLVILIYAWKKGFLDQIGVFKTGNLKTKLITLALFIYIVLAGTYAYFGKVPDLPIITAKSNQALKILVEQVFVSGAEEFLFR